MVRSDLVCSCRRSYASAATLGGAVRDIRQILTQPLTSVDGRFLIECAMHFQQTSQHDCGDHFNTRNDWIVESGEEPVDGIYYARPGHPVT